MSNVYSLDQLRQDIETEYAPLKLEVGNTEITLRSVMRLGRTERKTVLEAIRVFQVDDGVEPDPDVMFDAVKTVLSTVTADNKGAKLVKEIGEDFALAMKIVTIWVEATQPGEASNSPA